LQWWYVDFGVSRSPQAERMRRLRQGKSSATMIMERVG
jgi:hypothetical protein